MIQERPLQYARKAYSRTLKGMFLNQEKHVGRLRGVKILTNSKRRKEREGWGKRLPRNPYKKEVTTPNTAGPSPDPSPGGKGSDHRDTPIRRISALCCPLLVSTIVLTLCDICMPEAFCEFETVRKKILLNL